MCDDLIAIGDPRRSDFFPISIAFCGHCKTAHQNYQIPKTDCFPPPTTTDHVTPQMCSTACSSWLPAAKRSLGRSRGSRLLDIGCNDGSLLSFFARHGAKTYGIEPTDAAQDAGAAGHLAIKGLRACARARLFASNGQPDIVTFTNVFAHIENLKEVLAAIRPLHVASHPAGDRKPLSRLRARQLSVRYVLSRTSAHLQLRFLHRQLRSARRKIVACEFPARYGGNIRVMMQIEPPQRSYYPPCRRMISRSDSANMSRSVFRL